MLPDGFILRAETFADIKIKHCNSWSLGLARWSGTAKSLSRGIKTAAIGLFGINIWADASRWQTQLAFTCDTDDGGDMCPKISIDYQWTARNYIQQDVSPHNHLKS
jgi:hypothetical protein